MKELVMSTLSTINAIQQKISDLAPTNSSDSNKSSAAGSFEKVLDQAINAKKDTAPAANNLATDLSALEATGLLSAASNPTSIEAGFEGIFNELSTGIASSFAAALAGEDSATAVAPTAEEIAAAAALADETAKDDEVIATKDNLDSKQGDDEAATPFYGDKAIQMANSALSALEDTLFKDDEEEQQKG